MRLLYNGKQLGEVWVSVPILIDTQKVNMCIDSEKKSIEVKESIGYECAVKIHPIMQKYILFFATASS